MTPEEIYPTKPQIIKVARMPQKAILWTFIMDCKDMFIKKLRRRIFVVSVALALLIFILCRCIYITNLRYIFGDAARRGDVKSVKTMIKQGLNPNVNTGMGMTALKWAVAEGHTPVVLILLDNGANPNTAVEQAVIMKRRYILKLLILRGATLNSQEKQRVLVESRHNGWTDVIAILNKAPQRRPHQSVPL